MPFVNLSVPYSARIKCSS